jgi:hypothetical protein
MHNTSDITNSMKDNNTDTLVDYDTSYTPHKVVDEDANKAEEQRVFFKNR